jgi:NADH dehydrogenase/NADH:ubiquinone oxidoreductase subunit G
MMVSLTIDNKKVEVQEGSTVLEAAREAGVKIPTLCYNKYLKPYGGCRMCLVEVSNPRGSGPSLIVSSCTFPAAEGIVVDTTSDKVREARKFIVELLLARCPDSSDIQQLAQEYNISISEESSHDDIGRYLLKKAPVPEHTKCILCGLCVRVCAQVVQRNALSLSYRGTSKKVRTPFNKMSETCIGCGSCAYLCPTNTITVEEAG